MVRYIAERADTYYEKQLGPRARMNFHRSSDSQYKWCKGLRLRVAMGMGILPVMEDRSWYRKKFSRGTLAAKHLAELAPKCITAIRALNAKDFQNFLKEFGREIKKCLDLNDFFSASLSFLFLPRSSA
jgi:hypothetical protein